jgi:hypothetical protein
MLLHGTVPEAEVAVIKALPMFIAAQARPRLAWQSSKEWVMNLKPVSFISAAIAVAFVAAFSPAPASAGNFGGVGGGPGCHGGGGVNITKIINIWKPVNINTNINIWKSINIEKNITINKNVNVSAEAFAFAAASANANAGTIVFAGSSQEETIVNKGGEAFGQIASSETCETQVATVVKAIHAICVSYDGREFPASHMLSDTWIDGGYEGEVARCIPGSHIKVVIGDVLQSDQGMAGTYSRGTVFMCAEHEALRHFKDGMLKCAPAIPVKDCTERTNLRKYGTADFFFSYRAQVCATPAREAEARPIELTGMSLQGGVGP